MNKDDFEARQMYDDAMKAIIDNMIRVSHSGLTYVADMKYDRIAEDKMDHLSCFSGGLFALGAKSLRTSLSDKYMDLAKGLTNTCHESYQRSPTKLGPEAFRYNNTYMCYMKMKYRDLNFLYFISLFVIRQDSL